MLIQNRFMAFLAFLALGCFFGGVGAQRARSAFLDPATSGYATPLAGDGFDTVIFGQKVTVPSRNRRKVNAWDLGASVALPGAQQSSILPMASLYFWRRPLHEEWLFRAIIVGLYNDVIATKSLNRNSGLELVSGFESFTIPFGSSYYAQGRRINEEELSSGWARVGVGLGVRRNLRPFQGKGEVDNMMEGNILVEPGFFYFLRSRNTSGSFAAPQNHLELRLHSRVRYDALKRNLLELPHQGFAFGADATQAIRTRWDDWGMNGQESATSATRPGTISAYVLGAVPVPVLNNNRHRLLGTLHGGAGWDLDRFSRFNFGGGPTGEEYYAISRPVLPGSFINEFLSNRYAIGVMEYRWEPVFFLYFSARASLAHFDRERYHINGNRLRQENWLSSWGGRVTTGFIFDTRLQVDYNYSPSIIRDDRSKGTFEIGAHELTAHVSGEF